MSPVPVTIFINPPPIISNNQFRKLCINQKIPFSSPVFRTLKTSEFGYRKSVRLKKPMASDSIETGIVGGCDNERITLAFEHETLIANDNDTFHQTVGGLHVIFNKLSKWIVAVTFGGFILLRHDALALWAAMGCVLNVMLSITLKKTFKQERPDSGVKSGPYGMSSSNAQYGMPSSHAQSIFFTLVFVILSVVTWQGLNGVTVTLCLPVVALGCYFSWLRSLLRYHTTSQVIAGAVVGSVFSVLWFLAWESIVHEAYNSSLWARILVIVGGFCFCIGFFVHVIQHWLKDED